MRRLTICIVLTLSLAPAGAALAKEPVAAKVCGPSDCHTTKDRDALQALIGGGPPADPPKRDEGWYSLLVTIQTGPDQFDDFSMAIVPSKGLLRAGDAGEGYAWMSATPAGAREYRRITRDLTPFAAGTLKDVGAPGTPKARVDEVVRPPKETQEQADGGGSSPLPWIAGGLVLVLALAGLLIRRRGSPWPKPAEG
jgi:hypothetical protein